MRTETPKPTWKLVGGISTSSHAVGLVRMYQGDRAVQKADRAWSDVGLG